MNKNSDLYYLPPCKGRVTEIISSDLILPAYAGRIENLPETAILQQFPPIPIGDIRLLGKFMRSRIAVLVQIPVHKFRKEFLVFHLRLNDGIHFRFPGTIKYFV